MESWPRNMPATLEDLCVQYCVKNLETFTHQATTTHHTTMYTLFPGVSLPKTICDKIFHFYMEHVDHAHSTADGFLNIFSNVRGTQLSRLTLANSYVSDCGLGLVKHQPIVELDLSCCTRLSSDCIPFINKMGKTLRSLRLENTTDMFEGVRDHVDSISAAQNENYIDKVPVENVEQNDDPILNCPHLRKLCMRDFQLEDNLLIGNVQLHDVFRWCKLLTHLDLSQCTVAMETFPHFQCLHHLLSLSLADVDIQDLDAVIDNLCQLKQLKHLDVSQGQSDTPVMYPHPEQYLQQLVAGLPLVTSLDISGTNLAGFEKAEIQSFRPSKNHHEETSQEADSAGMCSIPGLEGRMLEFLGLFGCAHDACYRKNIPAKRVTGESDEEQVLLSLQVYQDRCGLLIKALNSVFHLFRNFAVSRQCAVLEAILAGMKRHIWDKQVQIVGSASLFYIAKGDQKDYITQKQRR
ncbi:protein zer-1 homolog [Haliotis rubra]|uniref:protein zer-1 homolog n=1 Tax=Haliotis rubra TaxID=36100 RepID=UPI001EE5A120|nr:protein zer-1 homolog [Haliotis rubra]